MVVFKSSEPIFNSERTENAASRTCQFLLPLAFVIGYTYMRRRSYRTVVLVHFLFNSFTMAVAGIAMF